MNHAPSARPQVSLAYLIHEVARLMKRRFEDEARVHGITLPQWRALSQIAKSDGISQAALAALTDTDPMTMSGILDRLEKRGLIDRTIDPSDSRAKFARLTEAGKEHYATAKSVGLAMYETALEGVTPAERQIVETALSKIRENLSGPTADLKDLQP